MRWSVTAMPCGRKQKIAVNHDITDMIFPNSAPQPIALQRHFLAFVRIKLMIVITHAKTFCTTQTDATYTQCVLL